MPSNNSRGRRSASPHHRSRTVKRRHSSDGRRRSRSAYRRPRSPKRLRLSSERARSRSSSAISGCVNSRYSRSSLRRRRSALRALLFSGSSRDRSHHNDTPFPNSVELRPSSATRERNYSSRRNRSTIRGRHYSGRRTPSTKRETSCRRRSRSASRVMSSRRFHRSNRRDRSSSQRPCSTLRVRSYLSRRSRSTKRKVNSRHRSRSINTDRSRRRRSRSYHERERRSCSRRNRSATRERSRSRGPRSMKRESSNTSVLSSRSPYYSFPRLETPPRRIETERRSRSRRRHSPQRSRHSSAQSRHGNRLDSHSVLDQTSSSDSRRCCPPWQRGNLEGTQASTPTQTFHLITFPPAFTSLLESVRLQGQDMEELIDNTDFDDSSSFTGTSMGDGESDVFMLDHEEVNLDMVPTCPEDQRSRVWMKVPTLASQLSPYDIAIQEQVLVQSYLNSLPIEPAEDVTEGDGHVCTICTVKRATRVITPCGHFLCADCMTFMVNNREVYDGVIRAKKCAVCLMAVGLFLRVY